MSKSTGLRLVSLLLLAAGFAMPASAQWQWLDANGKKVFSDQPPPLNVPESQILKQPGTGGNQGKPSGSSVRPEGAPATSPSPAPPADPAAKRQQAELEARKKQAEDAEKAKQKAEEQRVAAAKADSCQRAQTALATLNTGTPLRTMNAQGERIFMDETARNAEKQRLQTAIQQNCSR
jgi:hypothetical protein